VPARSPCRRPPAGQTTGLTVFLRCAAAAWQLQFYLAWLQKAESPHAERGIHIDANTAATGWRGERMDYGIAIDSLLFRAAADRRVERGGAS
jgi:hypothetical protein